MKTVSPTLLALLLGGAIALAPACAKKETPPTSQPAARRYPLRGIVVEIRSAQSSLLVKHEDIPGFMPAMTMLFKVDATALKEARPGRPITATLVQRDDGFALEDVKPAKAQ